MINTIIVEKKGYGTVQRDFMKLNISIYAKCVYTLLRTYTGDKTSCYPSLSTICEDLNISKNTTIKAIKELESLNLIAVKRSKEKNKNVNMVNVYVPLSLTEVINLDSSSADELPIVRQMNNGGSPDEQHVVRQMNTNNNNVNNNNKEGSSSKKKSFIPPSEQEVVDYFKEKGYSEESAKKAFEYYETGEWKDSKGTPVKNWKQKMISVWFKEENKTKATTQNKLVF